MKEKLCPLLSHPGRDVQDGVMYVSCMEESCGWWRKYVGPHRMFDGECAIVSLTRDD